MFAIGHSAKFGSYTLMHMESNTILDVQLIQVGNFEAFSKIVTHYSIFYCLHWNILHVVYPKQSNEVGGSYHMEKEGLKRCLDKLESSGLAVDCIITDRHPQIQKYLRERSITQFYDMWHFEKGKYFLFFV